MRIVVCAHEAPFPGVRHAGGQFLLRHLEELADDHDIQLFVPGSPTVREVAALVPARFHLTMTEVSPRRLPLRDIRRWVARRLRFRALRTAALRGLLDGGFVEAADAADIVELQWMQSAVLAAELRAAGSTVPIVIVAHDVTAASVPALRRLRGSRWRDLLHLPLDRIRRRGEVADLNAADLVIVFKAEDRELLADLGVGTPSLVAEPSIEFPEGPLGPRESETVLFTGAMWRPENELGVTWLLEHVWPGVVALVPGARLLIVGDRPSALLQNRTTAMQAVEVVGGVEDLDPFYRSASVFVAPLFASGGRKFKVPQAMAYELPVVATTVAVEGSNAPPDALFAVTDDPGEMAAALVDALTNPASAREVGQRAGAWIRSGPSFETSTAAIASRYRELADRRAPRRAPR